MSERELRDRLRAEVEDVRPVPGLADAVERGARRRRAGRLVAAGAAVLAVVGGVVVLAPDRTPAPVAAADPGPGCVELPAPAEAAPAPAGTDVSGWGYRGDPTLEADVAGLGRTWLGQRMIGDDPVTATVPLAGRPVAVEGSAVRHWVYALALRQASGWQLMVGEATTSDQGTVPVVQTLLPLPAPAPGAVVSAYAPVTPEIGGPPPATARTNRFGVLMVLAAPGTQRVDYLGCRDGRTVRLGADGDTLIEPVGQVEAAGRVSVRAGGREVSSGRVQNAVLIALPPAARIGDSDGFRVVGTGRVTLLAEDRTDTVGLRGLSGPTPAYPRALVLATCAGRGGVTVEGVPVPCDGRPHTVRDGPVDLGTDTVTVLGSPDPATGRTSLDVGLAVAEPVR